MPIGPSHGSRGGGSSFGGGSRSSGGSRRSSSSSGGNLLGSIIGGVIGGMLTAGARRRRREMYSGGDGGAYEAGPATPSRRRPTKYLVWAIVFAIFASITMSFRTLFVSSMKECNTYLATIEADYKDYYKPMIDTVKGNPTQTEVGVSVDCGNGYYKTKATYSTTKYSYYGANPKTPAVYEDFTKDNITYYFIVYKYYDVVADDYITGTTYTQFSPTYTTSGTIEIAYFNDGTDYYSMNTSYNLYTCAEYDYYEDMIESNEESAKTYLIAFIVELLIIAGLVTLYVFKLKKYKKLVKQDEELIYQKRQAETQKAQAEAQEAQIDVQRKNRFCQYCGSQIDEDTNTCTSCGARFSSDN